MARGFLMRGQNIKRLKNDNPTITQSLLYTTLDRLKLFRKEFIKNSLSCLILTPAQQYALSVVLIFENGMVIQYVTT